MKTDLLNPLSKSSILAIILLLLAAFVCLFTAAAHMSCIYLGPSCFEYQLAPQALIESSRQGTLLAPLGTIAASSIFVIWAAYALSAAGFIRRLPLLTIGTYTIAFLCLTRGLLGIQLWIRKPERLTEFGVVSNWIWFATGLLFLTGFLIIRRVKTTEPKK